MPFQNSRLDETGLQPERSDGSLRQSLLDVIVQVLRISTTLQFCGLGVHDMYGRMFTSVAEMMPLFTLLKYFGISFGLGTITPYFGPRILLPASWYPGRQPTAHDICDPVHSSHPTQPYQGVSYDRVGMFLSSDIFSLIT